MSEQPPGPTAPPADERSLSAALRHGAAWAVVFGAGESSFPLFAAFKQIPAHMFGRLSSIPALLGPLAQILSANLVDAFGMRKRFILGAVVVQMLCFVPLVTLAVCEPGDWLFWAFVAVTTTYYVAGNFSNPPWSGLIGELVPPERRQSYFARLTRLIGAVGLATQLCVMLALYLAPRWGALAWVYAGAFALAGLARLATIVFIAQMRDPAREPRRDVRFTMWQFFRRVRESNFVHFVIFVALFHLAAMISMPFFLPYFVYHLGQAQWHWLVLAMVSQVSSILTLVFWGQFSQRFGNWRTLKYTSIAAAILPVGWLFTDEVVVLALLNVPGGAAWAGLSLSTWNYILEAVSSPKRPRCVAYFAFALGVGIFAGSEIGGLLVAHLGREVALGAWKISVSHTFIYVLVISCVARLLVAVVFLPTFKELRNVQPLSLKRWFFQIARYRPAMGLRFWVIPAPPERRAGAKVPPAGPPGARGRGADDSSVARGG